MTKRELTKLVRELKSTVKDLEAAVKANDYTYAALCMDDVEGIGAQIREEVETKS